MMDSFMVRNVHEITGGFTMLRFLFDSPRVKKIDVNKMSNEELEEFIKKYPRPKKDFSEQELQAHLLILSNAEERLRILNLKSDNKLLDEIVFEGYSEFAARMIHIESIMNELKHFPETYEIYNQKFELLKTATNRDLKNPDEKIKSAVKLMTDINERAQTFITELTKTLADKKAMRCLEEKNSAFSSSSSTLHRAPSSLHAKNNDMPVGPDPDEYKNKNKLVRHRS